MPRSQHSQKSFIRLNFIGIYLCEYIYSLSCILNKKFYKKIRPSRDVIMASRCHASLKEMNHRKFRCCHPSPSWYSIKGIRIVLRGEGVPSGISRGGRGAEGTLVCSAPAAYAGACTRSLVP